MANIAKRVLIKSRDKLLTKVIDSLQHTNGAIEKSTAQQLAILQTIQDQIEVLKYESSMRDFEIDQRLKNSGTIQVSASELITKTFSGLKIYLDPRDISVTPHLALDSIWEYHITAAWRGVVKPHDTVIDIGANFGYFGALAAQMTDKKDSKVVFFEANPALIPYIRKTLSVNWLNEQSVVENLAVSDKEGTATLHVLKDYIGSSSLLATKHIDSYMHEKMHIVETESSVDVPATTLDAYCKKHKIGTVDLIKMDIEGFEDKAYDGMRQIIKASPHATLFVEFTKESYSDPRDFYDKMLEDFKYVYLINSSGALIPQSKTDYESVIGNPEDWIMPVFSKNKNLAAPGI